MTEPKTEPKTAPTAGPTREKLIVQWREARRRREAAELGSDAFRAALDEIARIEVEIARIEQPLDAPRA